MNSVEKLRKRREKEELQLENNHMFPRLTTLLMPLVMNQQASLKLNGVPTSRPSLKKSNKPSIKINLLRKLRNSKTEANSLPSSFWAKLQILLSILLRMVTIKIPSSTPTMLTMRMKPQSSYISYPD